ncbi:MAG TPA: DNA replication and repair protein RecF, partial [Actinomycetota bacterium]|nr:DNA replication and repair protein RecF [Actinomycetota bacterium]
MHLAWLELRDFRNHAHTRLDRIPEGLIVVVGRNGEGKTNLLEGMFLLYALRSPRASTNAPLVREGADVGYVRGEFDGLEGRSLVEVEIPRKGASRVKLNTSPLRRKRELRRQIRAVLFGPFDLPIVIGDPSKRRDLMDEAVVALWPLRDGLATAYERALRQRNRLLKEWEGGRGGPSELEAWDEELIRTGVPVIEARGEAVARLAGGASAEFEALAGYGLVVEYAPNVSFGADGVEDGFRAQLASRRADELVRRTSLVGPHRDDLTLAVRDLGARAFGSHGETWAAALCLRLGIAAAVADEAGEQPLLLVDDPFSALDPTRRDRIAERLAGRGGQVVISVA